ncbi:Leucine-rich repeat-containing protein 15 [Holothuria leucospilota]|uniref:Leucine-rich repeat-containing protein 15 n=1 Tax=Holothuria leucospilota TaxID=206669 RepID=A0A9Q0YDI6_HOLLE|nr:Leucine-rich repeat-containing protein 15 [Holothuria leucospilota]
MSEKTISLQKYVLSFVMALLMVKLPFPAEGCLTVPGCECPRGPLYVYCNRQPDIPPGTGVTLTVIPPLGDDIIYLSVSGHNIQRLNSSQLVYSSLMYLFLIDNQIEILDDGAFRHLINLERLWLPSNRILVLGPSIFSGITKLTRITLDNNINLRLEGCSFSTFPELTHLSLKNTSIDFNLNLFNSSKCLISYIPRLIYLDITFSATEKIDAELLDSFNAQTLYMGNENITVSYNALEGQPQVQRLHLCFIKDEFFNRTNLSIYQRLTFLKLSDSLSYFPKNFLRSESLQDLYFFRTGFQHLPANAFESLPQLRTLSFVGTSLSSIDKTVFGGIPSVLRSLDLTNNNLMTIPRDSDIFGSPDLDTLEIGNTGFYIDISIFDTVTNLEFVSFYNFSEAFFLGGSLGIITSLKSVYLYDSPPFFPKQFLASDSIENLIISRTAMSSLPANAFDVMPRLRNLKITNCNLRTIHRDAFNNTPLLEIINLGDNLLSTLPDYVFGGKTEASITLEGNPWKCDCNLRWFQTFFSQETGNLGFCYTPPSMHGTGLSKANFSEFVCSTTYYAENQTSTDQINTTSSRFEISSEKIRATTVSLNTNTTSVINATSQQTQTVSQETELPKVNYEFMYTYFKYVSAAAMVTLVSLTFLVCGVVLVARCKQFRFKFNVEQQQLNELSCQNSDGSQVVEKYSEIHQCDDMTPGSTQL